MRELGGKENLISAAHCATRLRLVIADNGKVNKGNLENTDGVKGFFEAAGQLQIIIGTGTVNKVYDEFIALAGIEAASKDDVKAAAASKAPWYKQAIKTLGDIFVPIIPAIVATGLLNGLLGGLSKAFPDLAGSQIYTLLNIFSNSALTFLPILIAISAAKIFGGNQFLGAIIGMPIVTAANVSQGAAALAVALKTKNKKTKAMALPASLSAFLGITEPAIFGVNVRFMRPFIAGMIGGACGAAVASLTGVYATANGVTGVFGFLITTDSFVGYLLTFLVSAVVAFVVSWFMGIKEDVPAENKTEKPQEITVPEKEYNDDTVYSPLEGKVVALTDVPDATFAEGVLGLGAAIEPAVGEVIAPADGEVSSIFDTHHAVGLTLDNGMELIIHVGINTVSLNGEGFTAHVSEGDRVKRGQPLISFDKDFIASKGYPTITPVIISNADDYMEIKTTANAQVKRLDELLTVEKG